MHLTAHGRSVVVAAICGALAMVPFASPHAAAAAPTPRWLETFAGPTAPMSGSALAVDASGRRVYVLMSHLHGGPSVIVAYSARTGEQLWRWSNRKMVVNDIAADPSRARLYITGGNRWSGGQLFLTSALDGRTGARLWRARLDPPGAGSSNHVAIAPDGGQVYIAGSVRSEDAEVHWLVVAYGGSSGSRRWTGHLGRAYRQGFASDLSVTPEGSPVLAGTVDVRGDCHAAAGALAPSDGARSWFRVLGRTQDCGFELLEVNASSVFVEWEDRDPTLASLDPSDGAVIWSRTLPRLRLVSTLAATPSLLIVEGGIRRRGTVAAFDSDDGTRAWSTELRRVDAYGIYALHAPPGGDAVYAAGSRRRGEAFVTALALGNGGRRGSATYDGTWSVTQWVALDSGRGRVYVAGGSIEGTNGLTEAIAATASYRAWV